MKARLRFRDDGGDQERTLAPTNTIGRHPSNSIEVRDRSASRRQCRIDQEHGQWILRDSESLGGTYVNGERIAERALKNGDQIRVGQVMITVVID
jgi:adenylate cyclase